MMGGMATGTPEPQQIAGGPKPMPASEYVRSLFTNLISPLQGDARPADDLDAQARELQQLYDKIYRALGGFLDLEVGAKTSVGEENPQPIVNDIDDDQAGELDSQLDQIKAAYAQHPRFKLKFENTVQEEVEWINFYSLMR
jgi:hypothetical protein